MDIVQIVQELGIGASVVVALIWIVKTLLTFITGENEQRMDRLEKKIETHETNIYGIVVKLIDKINVMNENIIELMGLNRTKRHKKGDDDGYER